MKTIDLYNYNVMHNIAVRVLVLHSYIMHSDNCVK